jgi:hypothetical protein
MNRLAAIVAAALVLAAPSAYAQWAALPNPSVPRNRTGEAMLTAAAPKARARKPDLSGVWLADSEPVPQEVGLTIEADTAFPRYMINVAADIPFDEVPLQAWAKELLQQRLESGGVNDPVAHCKPTGLPLLNTAPLPFKLVQMPGLVVMLYEENNVFRQIFLDGRKPVEDPVPQALGYSTGRWEGRELVVDTIGFSDRHWLDAMGHPLTEQLHLVERFRRPNAGHLEIETTIDDPGAYTKPFTYTVKLTLQPDEDLLEYFCTDNEKDSQHYQ